MEIITPTPTPFTLYKDLILLVSDMLPNKDFMNWVTITQKYMGGNGTMRPTEVSDLIRKRQQEVVDEYEMLFDLRDGITNGRYGFHNRLPRWKLESIPEEFMSLIRLVYASYLLAPIKIRYYMNILGSYHRRFYIETARCTFYGQFVNGKVHGDIIMYTPLQIGTLHVIHVENGVVPNTPIFDAGTYILTNLMISLSSERGKDIIWSIMIHGPNWIHHD